MMSYLKCVTPKSILFSLIFEFHLKFVKAKHQSWPLND